MSLFICVLLTFVFVSMSGFFYKNNKAKSILSAIAGMYFMIAAIGSVV